MKEILASDGKAEVVPTPSVPGPKEPEEAEEPDVLDHGPDGCEECLAEESAEEERRRLHEDDLEAEALQGEAEPKRYHRWRKCPVCRRYVAWDAPGPRCEGRCGEPLKPEEALVELGPVLAAWNDVEAASRFLYPPVHEVEVSAEGKALRAFLGQVKALVDEALLTFEVQGIHVKAVDPAHVAMIDVVLPAEILTSYRRPQSDGELAVGVDVDKVLEAVRKRKDKLSVAFRFGPGSDKPRATVTQGGYARDMVLLDPREFSIPKIPKMDMKASFEMPLDLLLEAVKDAGSISDHIRMTADEDGIEFLAEGDVDQMRASFPFGEEGVARGPIGKERASSLYPLDYLEGFLKTLKAKGALVTLSLATDYPLRIDWDGPVTRGTYLLAPRIETE